MEPLRWGICSAGLICDDFVNALSTWPEGTHKVQAVAARNEENARKFAQEHRIPKFYSDYQSLFNDQEVDIIYVGTINSSHENAVLAALEAGKHVLCEKPMGVNANETARMIRKAEEKRVFLMEAYWTRFFPAMTKLKEVIKAGVIGEAKIINANFGYILVPEYIWCPPKIVTPTGTHEFPLPESDRVFHFPHGIGLAYEAEHVRQCLIKGLRESPAMTMKESLIIAEINDEIRRQVGVRFPQDEK